MGLLFAIQCKHAKRNDPYGMGCSVLFGINSKEIEMTAIATTATSATTAPATTASLVSMLESETLTRKQKKAIAYAIANKDDVSVLRLSKDKTDAKLVTVIDHARAIAAARGNNQKIHAYILACNGSADNFPLPENSKLATLFAWVASLEARIRGKDDSTDKARETRRRTINHIFGQAINMVEQLRVIDPQLIK